MLIDIGSKSKSADMESILSGRKVCPEHSVLVRCTFVDFGAPGLSKTIRAPGTDAPVGSRTVTSATALIRRHIDLALYMLLTVCGKYQ